MIPLYKLKKLPRSQQLRKIAKYFGMAEKRLPVNDETHLTGGKKLTDIFSVSEFVFFCDAVKLLFDDSSFSDDAHRVFGEAAVFFESYLLPDCQVESSEEKIRFCRALNNIKHILLTETGGLQADWNLNESDILLSDGSRLDPEKRQIFKGMQVYMEDIRSPFNIGAMFRTCESFGVEKIILSPFSADPNHTRAKRTAMGCIDIVPWEVQELFVPHENLSENTPSCPVFALETGGAPMDEFPFPESGLLIAGSEELGVSPHALKAADASLGRVSIPCYGVKASLNVSVALGIALNAWAQRLSHSVKGEKEKRYNPLPLKIAECTIAS